VKFKEVAKEWLEVVHVKEIKNATYVRYKGIIEQRLNPQFGDKEMNTITKREIQLYVSNLAESESERTHSVLSGSSVRMVVAVLKLVFNYAYDYEIIDAIPTQRIRQPKPYRQDVYKVFTRDEQIELEELVRASKDDANYGIILSMYTGMRLGEVCALNWDDIDFEEGLLHVTKTYSVVRKEKAKGRQWFYELISPKTATSTRVIPLPPYILEDLKQMKERSNLPFVFNEKGEKRMHPKVMRWRLVNLLETNNKRVLSFHALRHTFATRAVENGMDVKTLSAILGHANASTTLNIYSHQSLDYTKEVMKNFPKIEKQS